MHETMVMRKLHIALLKDITITCRKEVFNASERKETTEFTITYSYDMQDDKAIIALRMKCIYGSPLIH